VLQIKHAVDPVDGWYEPPAHPLHELAPASEYVPMAQEAQMLAKLAPVVAENLPAAHDTQTVAPPEVW
jgi:hypothetical protein